MDKEIKVGKYTIALSHLDKILFPQSKITKEDLIEYYKKIADYLLPHVKDRLIVMHRYPNGIDKEGFYQKQIPDFFPKWIHRKTIDLKKEGKQTLVLLDKAADLVYLANQAVIVMHAWLSTKEHPTKPSKIVFDLDPSEKDLDSLRFSAKHIKKLLESYDLVPYVMTTGSRGYHVVAPIKQEHTFSIVRDFLKKLANQLAEKYPDLLTTEMSKENRKGRIFIDYLRNSYGATSVAPYAVRAKEHAPIATPIDWDELNTTKPQDYTIKNIFMRLAKKTDPWKDFEKNAHSLKIK